MFSKGDKVISNKYGIGVVVKPSFLRSTVDFGKEKKTVFNNTLTLYKEENNNTLEEKNIEPKPSLVIEDTLEEVQPAIIFYPSLKLRRKQMEWTSKLKTVKSHS